MSEFAGEIRLNRIMRELLHSMVGTIEEDVFYEPLVGGGNSPAWILGHIALGHRYGAAMLGGEPVSHEESETFGPGSSPILDREQCPSKAQLVASEEQACQKLLDQIASASAEHLDEPNQSPFLREEFPRVRDMISHLLASHLAMHVGQLSAWRRSRGYPSILQV